MTINFTEPTQEQQSKAHKAAEKITKVIKESKLDYEEIVSLLISLFISSIAARLRYQIEENSLPIVEALDNERSFIDGMGMHLKKMLEDRFLDTK